MLIKVRTWRDLTVKQRMALLEAAANRWTKTKGPAA